MALAKNSSPNTSDAARLLTKGFRFLRFDEPLETEFRTEHRSRLRVWNRIAIIVSACTVLGFAILDHFVLSRRAFAHHQHGALRHARARGHPHAAAHLEAFLRSLV